MASRTQSNKKKTKPTVLLVDADQYCYKVAAALERGVDWGDGIHTLFSDDREGVVTLEKSLADLKDRLGATSMIMCLSSERNFRKELDASYKDNRRDMRKPLIYGAMREFLVKNYKTQSSDGLEADDIMGIIATQPDPKSDFIIVSDDKDMQQIPGKLYRSGSLVDVLPDDGHRFHMWQTLVGDRADNYPGCPKIGEAKAEKLLDCKPTEMWKRVVETFKKAGLDEEAALLQARLAKILQWNDFDHKHKRVKLWTTK